MIDISKNIHLEITNKFHKHLNVKVFKIMDSHSMRNIIDIAYGNMGVEINDQFYTLIKDNLKK